VVKLFILEIWKCFFISSHRQNTQFVLENVINLYLGDIENRKYAS